MVDVQHSSMAGIDLHEDKRIKRDVRAASTVNVSLGTPGSSIDGVSLTSGDRILLKNQTAGAENGIWIWTGSATALTRATDADSAAADLVYGFLTFVREGTVNAASYWKFDTTSAITIGTTTLTFSRMATGGGGSEFTAADFAATGLTGATSASRYVGATTGGAPASGTFIVGDFVIDRSTGRIWICTVAGSPGTWLATSSAPSFSATGLTGAVSASRYAGATASAAPVSGTFVAGDFVVDLTGKLWICTTGGTPGTWVQSGSSAAAFAATGLTGATAASRYAGATASGAPGSGTFVVGDFVIDQTGKLWVCSIAGSPGTWVQVAGSGGTSGTGQSGAQYSSSIFQQTRIRATSNKTTTSTTFVAIDGTNLPPLSLTMLVGDVVRCRLSGMYSAVTGAAYFDFQVVQPALGTVRTNSTAASGATGSAPVGSSILQAEATFTATEAGTHTFQPVWRVTAGTGTLYNNSGATGEDVEIFHSAEKVGIGGALLAAASNLLYETTLTAATATIDTGTLSQSYRDLRIELSGLRSDTAALEAALLMRFNGDSAGNYDWTRITNSNTTVSGLEGVAATSIQVLTTTQGITGNTSTAGAATGISIDVPGYGGTTFWKNANLHVSTSMGTGAGNRRITMVHGTWHSTGAITSVQFSLSAGSFMAGGSIRVYGEPAAAGGPSAGTGTRLRISANQSIADVTDTIVPWDTEDSDTDSQHSSVATLSGNSAKTATSATLTGTGTAFLTELSVGQVISVPGTATEKRVVIGIASNTSLTVNTAFAQTASTQTVTRLNSPIVFRQPGFFEVNAETYWASNATGNRKVALLLNDTTVIGQDDRTSIGATAMSGLASAARFFQQWDFVEVQVRQSSGGALNLTADDRTYFSATSRPTTYVTGPPFVASGPSHATGWVPDPGATSGNTRFLREDGTFAVPPSAVASGGGGSGAMVPILAFGPIPSSQASFSFTGIPSSGFRNLRLVAYGRTDQASTATNILVQFNGDVGSSYDHTLLYGSSTAAAVSSNGSSAVIGTFAAASAPTGAADALVVNIPNYADTVLQKTGYGQSTVSASDTPSGNNFVQVHRIRWKSTAAINSITIFPTTGNFVAGTYACLYGEMDTGGVLLTPASNLLYETTLTAAQATIDTGTLSQAYRDLRVLIHGRTTAAVGEARIQVQVNGDTGTNYNHQFSYLNSGAIGTGAQSAGDSKMNLGSVSGTSAPTSAAAGCEIRIPRYSDVTYKKDFTALGTSYTADTVGNYAISAASGDWRNTAAITSIKFTPASGNFDVGTVVRVYGEPAAASGASIGTGTRLRISANQSITNSVASTVNWDTEDSDADNQHYTSAAALSSGTVAKAGTSATLTGTGTVFLADLSVGQVISVPGTATEKRVVTAIASNTSLTVNSPFVNTASTQVATRLNSPIVFRQPGTYTVVLGAYFAAVSSGNVTAQIKVNDTTVIAEDVRAGINAAAGYNVMATRSFQQWDFVEAVVTQTSAGAVNLTADERSHFEANARPTVVVAVPYVNIQDQKAQNTAGGNFTSGSFQTRTLNTTQSDSAGLVTLASNQITLPPGTYRVAIRCPAVSVNWHQARLQNMTDSTTTLTGSVSYANSGATYACTDSWISGRFTITGAKVFEVQHRANTTRNVDGFGIQANFGTEVYTVAEFWKEG